jgi:hypothetical protein
MTFGGWLKELLLEERAGAGQVATTKATAVVVAAIDAMATATTNDHHHHQVTAVLGIAATPFPAGGLAATRRRRRASDPPSIWRPSRVQQASKPCKELAEERKHRKKEAKNICISIKSPKSSIYRERGIDKNNMEMNMREQQQCEK